MSFFYLTTRSLSKLSFHLRDHNQIFYLMTEQKIKKVKIYLSQLKKWLEKGADILFETEGDEYDYIGKFGRGMWSEDYIRKGFTKADQDIIVEIAHGYGGFDY